MSTHSTVYVGNNTNLAELLDLKDEDGNVITNALVELESVIDRRTGQAVSGISVPATLTHVGNGAYRGSLAAGAGFVAGRIYEAQFVAFGGGGQVAEWIETLIAKRRAA
jgi:hypothetical protein